jgi:hypothetical protein
VLLPGAMKLLGDWNWYLPSRLEWLPSVSPEAELERPPRPLRRKAPPPAPVT